jgi:hypothetical protein
MCCCYCLHWKLVTTSILTHYIKIYRVHITMAEIQTHAIWGNKWKSYFHTITATTPLPPTHLYFVINSNYTKAHNSFSLNIYFNMKGCFYITSKCLFSIFMLPKKYSVISTKTNSFQMILFRVSFGCHHSHVV